LSLEKWDERGQESTRKAKLSLNLDSIDVFYGDIQVLWNLSMDVEKGKVISLIGSNGAGKTTCLKTIAGLLKPRNGKVTFEGRVTSKMNIEEIVDLGIVYVPEGRGLFPDMSVEENLILGSYNKHARSSREETIVKVYALFPKLQERKRQHASTLSGGEAQMLAIGRGMMAKPKLLLLDEPSSGIAPIVVDKIFDSIDELRKEGMTILLVEQDAGRALKNSDYAYLLENGKIALSGRGEELLENPYVKGAYLGM
jgi:branched-chain amino acid transport system ATP-binding protein